MAWLEMLSSADNISSRTCRMISCVISHSNYQCLSITWFKVLNWIQFPPWCSRVPNTMVPLILAGVDLNTFGFRRVFSFTSPCHWRYCPLPQRRGLASAQNHKFTTQSETRFIFQLHFVTTIPSLTHFNGKRFLLRPVFLFIVFIGLFGLVLLRIFPFTDISGS